MSGYKEPPVCDIGKGPDRDPFFIGFSDVSKKYRSERFCSGRASGRRTLLLDVRRLNQHVHNIAGVQRPAHSKIGRVQTSPVNKPDDYEIIAMARTKAPAHG